MLGEPSASRGRRSTRTAPCSRAAASSWVENGTVSMTARSSGVSTAVGSNPSAAAICFGPSTAPSRVHAASSSLVVPKTGLVSQTAPLLPAAALRNGPCAAGTALLQLVGQGDEVVAPESVSIVETRRPRLQAHVQPGHGGAHHGAR